ncbi:MAG: hypothetical protein NVSMB65_00350 [Chloroflexota bacterium]
MQALDGTLSSDDGVKWFNLLYLLVTRAVYQSPPAGGWADEGWLTQLDLTFAHLYFDALAQWYTSPATVARAWTVLFASRYQQDIERVQFALAGMNAHINHDLPLAVVQTCDALRIAPDRDSPQYRDFDAVNGILDGVEPEALTHLATGLGGVVAQDLGTVGHLLSMWSVYAARDTAWTNAELLWQLRDLPAARDGLLLVLDRMTGFAGRGLLVPVSQLVQGGG